MVKISVIMPIYNTATYLRKSIESVLNQTYTDFELICTNDGSTDNSAEILNEYATKDKRIMIIQQANQGLSEARNNGLALAKGEYIAFLDSDDYYAPRYLEFLVNTAENIGADIVGCEFQKIKHENDTIKTVNKVSPKIYPNALKVLLHKDNFIHFNVWNKLYKRDVIGDMRFVPHIYYEDWVFNCCVFERAHNFVWIKQKLYGYRISNNSIMRSKFNKKKLDDYIKGINEVYAYYTKNAPEKKEMVKQTRISLTVKRILKSAIRSKDAALINQTAKEIRLLKEKNLITYKGLKLKHKINLFIFLHKKL